MGIASIRSMRIAWFWILPALVMISGCRQPATDQPKELRKEITRLEREYRAAQAEAEKRGTVRQLPARPNWAPSAPPEAIRAQVQASLRNLLEFLVADREAREITGSIPLETASFIANQSDHAETLRFPAGSQIQRVQIENVGVERLDHPRLRVNGMSDWFDLPSLLASVLAPEMSDREKAFALWKFVVASRQHGRPAHPSTELHEPVRFLNVYGSGFCDDAAAALAGLAHAAGLPARVWDLSGHVVPEIFFDGKWNLLDPDGEVCYFEADGVTFADVESLQRDPERIRQFPSPLYQNAEELIQIYRSTENNRLSDYHERTRGQPHQMAYSLRPGESLNLSRQPGSRYFSSGYFEAPPEYGSGRLTFRPLLRDKTFQTGSESSSGLEAVGDHLATTAEVAEWQNAFSLPYPMLAGRVRLVVDLPENASLELALSEDGREWTHFTEVKGPGRREWLCDLTPFFRNGYGDPMYGYHVRLRFRQPRGLSTQLLAAEFQTDIQVAPRSLPKISGEENLIQFSQAGTSLARVTLGYSK